MEKETVFLTGASGSMGGVAFKELLKRKEKFNITLLLRPSKKNKKAFKKYEGETHPPVGEKAVVEKDGIKIIWGNIIDYEDVLKCVTGADYVLHPGALISPEADHKPRTTWATNYGGTTNIIKAIKEQPNRDEIKFVYIGSIAMYGDRLPPVHKIRVGDPIYPSVFDYYCLSKIAAERAVIESGLKYWASIRQTYICIPDTMALMDPIMSHQPLNQEFEMVTKFDAGKGLVNTIDAPEEFWRRVYNMGGGPSCRTNYYDYMAEIFELIGCGTVEKLFNRNWFALKNFHCGYYEDSDVLNDYLHFWNDSLEDHYDQIEQACPWYFGGAKIVPKGLIKMGLKRFSDPVKWTKKPEKYSNRIKAHLGSVEAWKKIPKWDSPILDQDKIDRVKLLDHGFEEKPIEEYELKDLQDAADFRGGECLSSEMSGFYDKALWKCAFDHEFEASPALVMMAGHWCPYCSPPDWNYGKIAEKNPFFAQVYYHDNKKKDAPLFKLEQCIVETNNNESDSDPYVMSMKEYLKQIRPEYE